MGWNTWLTVGLVMLALGVILFIIGIVWYEMNIRNRTTQNPWTYVFLIGGAAIGVIGCILIAIGLVQSDTESKTKTKLVESPPYIQGRQSVYVTPDGTILASNPPGANIPVGASVVTTADGQQVMYAPVETTVDGRNRVNGVDRVDTSKQIVHGKTTYMPVQQYIPVQNVTLPPVVISDSTDQVYLAPPKPVPYRSVSSTLSPSSRQTLPPSTDVGYKAPVKSDYVQIKQTPPTTTSPAPTTYKLPPTVVEAPVIEDDPELW